jgi:hypothetical protein
MSIHLPVARIGAAPTHPDPLVLPAITARIATRAAFVPCFKVAGFDRGHAVIS